MTRTALMIAGSALLLTFPLGYDSADADTHLTDIIRLDIEPNYYDIISDIDCMIFTDDSPISVCASNSSYFTIAKRNRQESFACILDNLDYIQYVDMPLLEDIMHEADYSAYMSAVLMQYDPGYRPSKNPGLAFLLSIFWPGLGHIYVGNFGPQQEYANTGLLIMLGTFILDSVGGAIGALAAKDSRNGPIGGIVAEALLVHVTSYILSIPAAVQAAKEYNKKYNLKSNVFLNIGRGMDNSLSIDIGYNLSF